MGDSVGAISPAGRLVVSVAAALAALATALGLQPWLGPFSHSVIFAVAAGIGWRHGRWAGYGAEALDRNLEFENVPILNKPYRLKDLRNLLSKLFDCRGD